MRPSTLASIPVSVTVPRPSSRASGRNAWRLILSGTLLRIAGGAAIATIVLILAIGAVRRPANPYQPLVLSSPERAECTPPETLRVGTFNIHGGRNAEGVPTLDRIAETVRDLDLVGLQEVRGVPLFGQASQSRQLGDRLSMASLFLPTEQRWGRDSIGNGMLSRVPVTSLQRIPLAGTQPGRFRNLIFATLPFGASDVRVLITHVDNQLDHETQLREVIALFLAVREPALLMGDLNTPRSNPQLERLLADDSVTAVIGESLPEGRRMRGVDWIIGRGLRCVRSETRDLGGSDHPAIVAELAPLRK